MKQCIADLGPAFSDHGSLPITLADLSTNHHYLIGTDRPDDVLDSDLYLAECPDECQGRSGCCAPQYGVVTKRAEDAFGLFDRVLSIPDLALKKTKAS